MVKLQPFTLTSVEAIRATGVLKAAPSSSDPTHYFVTLTHMLEMPIWQATRETAWENRHPYTVLLQNISLRTEL